MKYYFIKNDLRECFLRSTYALNPDRSDALLRTDDYNQAKKLIEVEKLVYEIIESEGEIFYIGKGMLGRKAVAYKNQKIFFDSMCLSKSNYHKEILSSFPIHSFNPFVKLFYKNVQDKLGWDICFTYIKTDDDAVKMVDILNKFIDSIRQEAKSPQFKSDINNYNRPSNKNYKSLMECIDKLYDKHSRLMVLRIDFGYKQDNRFPSEKVRNERYLQAVNDREHFFNNMRKNKLFKHMLNYAWKLEYGFEKGFHYHMFFFFDGSKRWKDKYRAKIIGEYWQNTITQGKGLFHNCNANQHNYDYLGIGIINASDTKLREELEMAVLYFTKADSCNVRMIAPNNGRTFGKGGS
ncbi:MAG: YagK/YfjJ domain-containing protein [Nitrososphaeraceae archaeon]